MISVKNIFGKNEGIDAPENADAKDGSIFGPTLSAGQILKTKKTKYLEEKNRKKAYIELGASVILMSLYSIFFFYGNASAYLKAPAQIAVLQSEISNYNDVILPSLEKTKELHKAAYDKEFEEIISSLAAVFPEGIDKLGIVRLFESFAVEVAAAFPPFEFTSINLGALKQENGYVITPVSTSIHSSLAGFDRFLSLVDRSGHIYEEGEDGKEILVKKIRLMSISNISVKYRGVEEATGKDQGVDFSVKLNVYSRTATQSDNK